MENGTEKCPKSYLVQSILVTIFCCLPFGLLGIFKACKVNSLYAEGKYQAAKKASKDARSYVRWGVGLALVAAIILPILYFFVGIGSNIFQ